MASQANGSSNPDLTQGVTLADFGGDRVLRGHVGKKSVLLVQTDDEIFAVSAKCSHYGGPLEKGMIDGATVRCPWHHACFSLQTGEALAAPAFDPLTCWQVEREGERIIVRDSIKPAPQRHKAPTDGQPAKIIIIGGGAAGFAAAEMLRRRGYSGTLTMLSDDSDAPCDRPNLSKDFLAGEASEKWLPLRPSDFYEQNDIDLRLGCRVSGIDVADRTVSLDDGQALPFDRLLIATGAEPVQLPIPGMDQPHVFTLRSAADSRAIIARAEGARTAVVLGSGFIGLEVAAALNARGLKVHVVSRDARPLEKVLGADLGDFLRALHEEKGETFHMENSIASIGEGTVTLTDGTELDADLVIIGVGVRPRLDLAEAAQLDIDRGILVDEWLETSQPGIFAAGDVARWPSGTAGETLRVEHWVVAGRQGQVAAQNMLGATTPFRDAPFFWSAHHDVTIRYAGHAEGWDEIRIDGDIEARDCLVSYRRGGRIVAVAGIGRDHEVLEHSRCMNEPA